MNISEITGRKLVEKEVGPDKNRPHPHTSVGIEIEVEGIPGRPVSKWPFSWWTVKSDGSLSNGLEFVSEPVWGTAISEALKEIDEFFDKESPYLSFRTSVHIHVNVLDISAKQLEHFIKLYLFYEPALFRLHSEWNRYENIFCVPAKKSIKIQDGYASLISDVLADRCRTSYVGCKYSALNPNSVGVFGTLEFRHMGGCADVEKISNWINILLQLKVAALNKTTFDKPSEVFGDQLSYLKVNSKDIDEGWMMLDYINYKGKL